MVRLHAYRPASHPRPRLRCSELARTVSARSRWRERGRGDTAIVQMWLELFGRHSGAVRRACRSGSNEFFGFFGESNVQKPAERALGRAEMPRASTRGPSPGALEPNLHAWELFRAKLARYFSKNGLKVLSSQTCTFWRSGLSTPRARSSRLRTSEVMWKSPARIFPRRFCTSHDEPWLDRNLGSGLEVKKHRAWRTRLLVVWTAFVRMGFKTDDETGHETDLNRL